MKDLLPTSSEGEQEQKGQRCQSTSLCHIPTHTETHTHICIWSLDFKRFYQPDFLCRYSPK